MTIHLISRIYHTSCITMLAALLLSGCGEFSYKRGASVSDLENTKKTCQAKGGGDTAIEKCLEDSGWVIQRFNEPDPVAEVSVNPDNRNAGSPVKAASISTASTDTAVEGKVAEDKTSKGETTSAPVIKKVADPMDTFKISSWWKLGGSAESLKAATEECVTVLGETHRPNVHTQNVTRGMLLCMREKGWRGLRAK
ncbi:MAG: hypothetical protein ACXW1P_07960 [Methylophilaceae bacterium]